MDLGIDKEFIESKKIEDVYWAKEIVDVYESDEEISDREKNAIICAVLKSALLGKDRTDGRLLNIVSFLKSINVREEDISGYIMCSAINNRNGPLAYGDLLSSSIMKLEEAFKGYSFDGDLKTQISKMDLLKAVSDNLNQTELEEARKVRKELGLDELFNPPITEKNVFVAQEIVNRYCNQSKSLHLSEEDKKSILFKILNAQSLQEKRGGCVLITLMQYVENIGLTEEQIYPFMINLAITGSALDEFSGVDYKRLLQNSDNATELLATNRKNLKCNVHRSTIMMARVDTLSTSERRKILEDYNQFDSDAESLDFRHKSANMYVLDFLIKDFCNRNGLDEAKGKLLLTAILKNNQDRMKKYNFIDLLQSFENEGFSFEEAEEIMIKMSIEDKISNRRGFTFSNLLGSRNKIDTIFKNQKDFDLHVTDKTFIRAQQILVAKEETSIESVKEELVSIGMDSNFIEQIHDENLITAKEIVDNYPFERELEDSEKAAIIKTILSYNGAGKVGTRYLKNLVQTFELMGLSPNDTYGIIINNSINGTSICKGASLSKVRSKNKSALRMLETAIEAGSEINRVVDEKVIKTMVFDYKDPYGVSQSPEALEIKYNQAKTELVAMGFERENLDKVYPQNLFMAKTLVDGYSFSRPINDVEKKALIQSIIGRTLFSVEKPTYYLHNMVRELLINGMDEQKVFGVLIGLFANSSINSKLRVEQAIASPQRLVGFIKEHKGEITFDVTDEMIEKAVNRGIPQRKATSKDIVGAVKDIGNGGSELFDKYKGKIQEMMEAKTTMKDSELEDE